MGIRSTLKKILPILSSGGPPRPPERPRPAPANRAAAAPDEEEDERSPRGDRSVKDYIEETLRQHKVVVFMKGSPQAPQCGFSANAAGILSSYGKPYHTINVLADPEVRAGVKDFSNWPTIPQIFIEGEFVGGSDILAEMHNNGELKAALEKAFAD